MTAAVWVTFWPSPSAAAMPKSITFTAPPGDHDVGRLDVAVDDAVAVAEVERGADVGHDLDDALLRHRALALDDLAQGLPVDELHDDVGQRAELALHLAGVVHATMAGWLSAAEFCASRRNRSWNCGSRARSARSTLIATSRPSRVSRPRCTSDMPP
jgi:hypothetical protein